ncbi:MAG: hypothetical protein EP297_04225 [Gammaproteobacteria bacterium]|nr:MAG: hypothetical protein EP297_04225 [Gammaproteobacteria bacterium]
MRLSLITSTFEQLQRLPWLAKQVVWFGFAILFYNSGYNLTVLLVEPENFTGGWQWFWIALFPLMLPTFFLVNRYCGCASGNCSRGQCQIDNGKNQASEDKIRGMPFI